MTLNDIMISALAQLGRGQDANTIEAFQKSFTDYANDAQSDIARAMRFSKTETHAAVNGILELTELSRDCIRVLRTVQLGREVRFLQGSGGEIALPYNDPVTVTYRCEPLRMTLPSDVSELPEYTHPLMVSYIVARERMAGDVSTQGGANIYISMYEAAKQKLRPHIGEHESYEIINRW